MLIVAQTENLCLMLTVVFFFQNLFNDQTTENTDVGGQDIIMKALNEAGIEPQHDLQGLMKELDDERAKTKQLTGSVKNQYSKLSRLRKNYQNQVMAAENERFRFNQAQKQLNDEKNALQEANQAKDAQIQVLSDQIEMFKSAMEASQSDSNYFEKLACERDRALGTIKAELRAIKAKLCSLSD